MNPFILYDTSLNPALDFGSRVQRVPTMLVPWEWSGPTAEKTANLSLTDQIIGQLSRPGNAAQVHDGGSADVQWVGKEAICLSLENAEFTPGWVDRCKQYVQRWHQRIGGRKLMIYPGWSEMVIGWNSRENQTQPSLYQAIVDSMIGAQTLTPLANLLDVYGFDAYLRTADDDTFQRDLDWVDAGAMRIRKMINPVRPVAPFIKASAQHSDAQLDLYIGRVFNAGDAAILFDDSTKDKPSDVMRLAERIKNFARTA